MSKQGIVVLHGKQYKTVALRVNEFRKAKPDYGLETEIIQNDVVVVMKAIIKNESGRVIATGYAEEKRNSTMINKTSAMENCETSAIGRALSAFGLAGEEYASADELAGAIHQQNNPPAPAQVQKQNPDQILAQFAQSIQSCDMQTLTNNFGQCWQLLSAVPEHQKIAKDLYEDRKAKIAF